MSMQDQVTAQERLSGLLPDPYIKVGGVEVKANYHSETSCDDCGEDIEEVYYTNKQNQIVHFSTHTNGHYYLDGGARCEACHEGSR
jgi:hypothetical protein